MTRFATAIVEPAVVHEVPVVGVHFEELAALLALLEPDSIAQLETAVNTHVFGPGDALKIFQTVITFYAVDVMYQHAIWNWAVDLLPDMDVAIESPLTVIDVEPDEALGCGVAAASLSHTRYGSARHL
jgi:hypothetical protein